MRDHGYYWVKVKGHNQWEIGHLFAHIGPVDMWSICGNECDFYEEDFTEIGPRIDPPASGEAAK